jgi:hypothetical protein
MRGAAFPERMPRTIGQYLGSPLEDQAIEPILAAPGNLSSVDQHTECLHKSFHQTSTQEYLVSRCLAFGYTPSPVTLRYIRTLQKYDLQRAQRQTPASAELRKIFAGLAKKLG